MNLTVVDMTPSILVVDDDQDIASNMSDILKESGYRVDQAHNGSSALQLVSKNAYDVALLDFKMPDMNGADLYGKIKQTQPDVVAILVTAYAGDDGVQRAKAAGTWKVLRKPVDIPAMLGYVEEALQN